MRIVNVLLIVLLFSSTAFAQVKITDLVNDYAGILGSETQRIQSTLTQLKNNDLAEFAIVIIQSLEGRDIEGYAFELAEGKLGDKEKNNGLLLLIAVEDHKYRFEVGRGLEPVLPDILISRIGREYLVPHFRNNEYGKGVAEAVDAIALVLGGKTLPEPKNTLNKQAMLFATLLSLSIIIFIIFNIFKSIKQARSGKKYNNDNDFFLAAMALGSLMRKSGGKGGFGGFGGGSFGGGGASGGW